MQFEGRPELVARHAHAAAAWPEAARAWYGAATEAIALFANRDAERLLDLALEAERLAVDPELEARLLLARRAARSIADLLWTRSPLSSPRRGKRTEPG